MKTTIRLSLIHALALVMLTPPAFWVGSVHAQSGCGTVQATSGAPTVQTGANPRAAVGRGAPVGSGSTFQTSGADLLRLRFQSGETLTISSNTVATVSCSPTGIVVTVLSGTIAFSRLESERRGPPVTFSARSGTMTAAPGAVELTITADPTDTTQGGLVAVSRGEARLETPSGTIERILADQAGRWEPAIAPRLIPVDAAPAGILARINAANAAVIQLATADLPASAAGQPQQPVIAEVTQLPFSSTSPLLSLPSGGGACVGSNC